MRGRVLTSATGCWLKRTLIFWRLMPDCDNPPSLGVLVLVLEGVVILLLDVLLRMGVMARGAGVLLVEMPAYDDARCAG